MSRDHQTLPRLFLDLPFADGAVLPLEREQMHYLVNVLRLEAGDLLKVFNGRDGEWLATLIQPTRKTAALGLREAFRPQTAGSDIWYCFAPLKHARLDYIVQKAVEMGASRILPVLTRRTQTQRIKDERMRANVIEAAEQCGILNIPSVEEAATLPELVGSWPGERLLVLCDEDGTHRQPTGSPRPAQGQDPERDPDRARRRLCRGGAGAAGPHRQPCHGCRLARASSGPIRQALPPWRLCRRCWGTGVRG